MNLHQIVSGAISAVNPLVTINMLRSAGSTTMPDGTRKPLYAAAEPVLGQVQALQYNDLMKLDALNIQGARNKIYLNGRWTGVVRADQRGGDLLVMPNGDVFLVAVVLEDWPDWCSLACTLQNRV